MKARKKKRIAYRINIDLKKGTIHYMYDDDTIGIDIFNPPTKRSTIDNFNMGIVSLISRYRLGEL